MVSHIVTKGFKKLVTQPATLASFTRNSTAYNPETGEQVGINTPRFVEGPFAGRKALLVEEGTQNLIPSGYGKMDIDSDGNGTVDGFSNETYSCSPVRSLDGGQKITLAGATVSNAYAGVMVSSPISGIQAGTAYTFGVDAKLVRTGSETVEFGITWLTASDSTISATAIYLQNPGTEYKRLSVTGTAPANAAKARIWMRIRASSTSDTGSAWFRRAMFEAKPYATSFIDGTRSPEVTTIPTAGVLSVTEGTIEMRRYVLPSPAPYDYSRTLFYASANMPGLFYCNLTLANKVRFTFDMNGVQKLLVSSEAFPLGEWAYLALTWDETGTRVYINGELCGSTTDHPTQINGDLLNLMPTAWPLNSYIADLRISSNARSDQEILAAYQSNAPLPADEWTTYLLPLNESLDAYGPAYLSVPSASTRIVSGTPGTRIVLISS